MRELDYAASFLLPGDFVNLRKRSSFFPSDTQTQPHPAPGPGEAPGGGRSCVALRMGVPASLSSFPILGAGALRASHLDTTDEPLQGIVPQIGTELKVPRREQASGLLEDYRKDEGDMGMTWGF